MHIPLKANSLGELTRQLDRLNRRDGGGWSMVGEPTCRSTPRTSGSIHRGSVTVEVYEVVAVKA